MKQLYLVIFFAASLLLHTGVATAARQDNFGKLLQEGGLTFTAPPGFKKIPVEADYVMPYQAHYIKDDGKLEIRYAIRPLSRMEIEYNDPHNSAPAPNDLFNMLFRALSETLAIDHRVRSRDYDSRIARKKFNAGWATAGVFKVSPDVSKTFHHGMLIAIHQNDKADAYSFFLSNDLSKYRKVISTLSNSLKFKVFENPINQPPSDEELKNLPMIPES